MANVLEMKLTSPAAGITMSRAGISRVTRVAVNLRTPVLKYSATW